MLQRTLSLTSPTRISICSGADKDLPFRFRWIKANSTPSLSAMAVTLVTMIISTSTGEEQGQKRSNDDVNAPLGPPSVRTDNDAILPTHNSTFDVINHKRL